MSQRQVRLRVFERRLGLKLYNKHKNIMEFWSKLQNSSALDCKESLNAMLNLIDDYGQAIWGPKARGNLLIAGKYVEYPRNLYWPEDKQKIIDICIEMRQTEIDQVPGIHSSASSAMDATKDSPSTVRRALSQTPRKAEAIAKHNAAMEYLNHVQFWLVSTKDALHGKICPYNHKTISGLFHAVRIAMYQEGTGLDQVVEKLIIHCPPQAGLIAEVLSQHMEKELGRLRTRLGRAFEALYSVKAGETMICFVEVMFKPAGMGVMVVP